MRRHRASRCPGLRLYCRRQQELIGFVPLTQGLFEFIWGPKPSKVGGRELLGLLAT